MKDYRNDDTGFIENPGDIELMRDNTVDFTYVYMNSFNELIPAELKWRTLPELG